MGSLDLEEVAEEEIQAEMEDVQDEMRRLQEQLEVPVEVKSLPDGWQPFDALLPLD